MEGLAMSEGRKPKLKDAEEDVRLPEMKLEVRSETADMPAEPLSPEQLYLRRKSEVTRQDHEAFPNYRRKRGGRARQRARHPADPPRAAPTKLNRRTLLTWAAGTAAVGEAVTLGYPLVSGPSIPDQ